MQVLELELLSVSYDRRQVLHEVTQRFLPGQVSVLIGPNGSGKSTLLKACAGLLKAQGEVRVCGERLGTLSSRRRSQLLSYLPQSRSVPDIPARALVLHGRFPYLGYPRRYSAEDFAAAERAMDETGVLELAERPLPSLSGGERQRVYLAMLLAQQTPVVLLYEPTTFLDIRHQLETLALARKLADTGKTVLLVLHDLNLALETADSLVLLSDGTVAAQGSAEQLLSGGALERVFGVSVQPGSAACRFALP